LSFNVCQIGFLSISGSDESIQYDSGFFSSQPTEEKVKTASEKDRIQRLQDELIHVQVIHFFE
jgi:hypothetical protein